MVTTRLPCYSLMAYMEPHQTIAIVIVTNDIFSTVRRITYNGSGSVTQWKFIVRFSYLRSPSSKSLFNVCAPRNGNFFLLCVCVGFFLCCFVFVVNKCRIWVFAWLMRARDSSLPLVKAIPGRIIFSGCSPTHTLPSCLLTKATPPIREHIKHTSNSNATFCNKNHH